MPRVTQAVLVVLGAAAVLLAIFANWSDIVLWAQTEQRTMQNQLARSIQAVVQGIRLPSRPSLARVSSTVCCTLLALDMASFSSAVQRLRRGVRRGAWQRSALLRA